MARPKKSTVDYFPHTCNHKTTIYILEQKFGNDGYAFWFKLLEILGSTENHYIDCSNLAKWEFLQAKTQLDDKQCSDILDLLSRLEAIDKDLWKEKVIWSQNFVDGISDVYKNRRTETPQKPSFYDNKLQLDLVSTDENPQTKLKETKVYKTKEKKSIREGEDFKKSSNTEEEKEKIRKMLKDKNIVKSL